MTDAASFIREARRITLRDYTASDEAAGEYAELEATIVGIVDYGECPYEHAMNGTSVSHGIDYYDAIYVSEEYLTEYTGGYGQYALFEKGASFSADEAFLQAIEAGELTQGVALCGSGEGMAMTLNKHQGIRAGLCWEPEVATLIRRHNNANVIVFPARFITNDEAVKMLEAFFAAEFEGGRHERRVAKIPVGGAE